MSKEAVLRLVDGDITMMRVDAIVNAANSRLMGGGGVDGAIHRAAGPELAVACSLLGGCPAGEAKTTPGFRLLAKYVIHTVGPVWRGGAFGERELLRSCYQQSLAEAVKHKCRTLAFPNISTGIYGFPKTEAAKIATSTVVQYLSENPENFDCVFFVCFDKENYSIYEQLLKVSGDRNTR